MNKPRDLTATPAAANDAVQSHENRARHAIRRAEETPDDPHQYRLIDVPSHLARGLLQRYARGDTLEALHAYFRDVYTPNLQQAARLSEKFFPEHRLRLHFEQMASWMLLAALVCFDDDGANMAQLDNWFTPDVNPVLYAMLCKALVPGFAYAAQYQRDSCAMPHEEELVGILLQPPHTWPQACAAYMKQWPRLMQRYGYREQVEQDRGRFEYFPLHLALAVCAFDIDDSAFRHLPCYPHELVDYYRAHCRHTRDAWRSGVTDPGIGLPENARPQPKKTYVLSKAEAYARWLELVCGEQPGLIDHARRALGKRKTMPALDAVMAALAGAGLALRADLKDDATAEAQAAAMCQAWQLPPPQIGGAAAHGPARISALLNALQAQDSQGGQRLAVLDDEAGNWNAILYHAHHEAEFGTLCQQLGIARLAPAQWQ